MTFTPAESAALGAILIAAGGFVTKYLLPLIFKTGSCGNSKYLTKEEHHAMCVSSMATIQPDISFIKSQTAQWNGQIKELTTTIQKQYIDQMGQLLDHEARIKSIELRG